MTTVEWGKDKAEAKGATYVGRLGYKSCLGIELYVNPKRVTICPISFVNDCQIDIPEDQIDNVINALLTAKAKLIAGQ